MTQGKIRSYPLNLIFFLLPYTAFVIFCDKIFIKPLYEFINKGEIIKFISTFFLFVLPLNFLLIIMLLHLLFSKVYIDDYGIFVRFLFRTYIVPWEKIKNCYWKEGYCSPEGDFSFYFLVIETSEKEIKLGPEWINREMFMKYIQKFKGMVAGM
jgi:hypothetical protein